MTARNNLSARLYDWMDAQNASDMTVEQCSDALADWIIGAGRAVVLAALSASPPATPIVHVPPVMPARVETLDLVARSIGQLRDDVTDLARILAKRTGQGDDLATLDRISRAAASIPADSKLCPAAGMIAVPTAAGGRCPLCRLEPVPTLGYVIQHHEPKETSS